jgi:hypothetical protein
MDNFTLDRTGLIFVSFSLLVMCFAVFDTRRFFRLLSLNRKTTLTPLELMIIRVPGAVLILGITWMIVLTLLRKT